MAQILVVDDEIGIRELLSEILADEGTPSGWPRTQARRASCATKKRPIWSCSTSGCPTPTASRCSRVVGRRFADDAGGDDVRPRHHRHRGRGDRIGRRRILEKPIALQKLLATVKKALKHEMAPAKAPLTLDAFVRSPLMKDLRKTA